MIHNKCVVVNLGGRSGKCLDILWHTFHTYTRTKASECLARMTFFMGTKEKLLQDIRERMT